ncbi:MAG: metallophosphoesterase, partial [Candidatus Methanoplasma sp.]|nr:metallophosphoesterase [Candidatus Methanoplasma sp.]
MLLIITAAFLAVGGLCLVSITSEVPFASADEPHEDMQIVTSSAAWRYLDDNTDPFLESKVYQIGLALGYDESDLAPFRFSWSAPHSVYYHPELPGIDVGFDDSSWKEGNGTFGYKNRNIPAAWGELGTTLNGNIPETDDERVMTYFFRYNFDMNEDPSWVKSLSYTLRYDDAVILYLNAEEIGRYNTAHYTQNLSYGAADVAGDYLETTESINIPAGLLRTGSNVLAVELHQDRVNSSDIYFDFMDLTLSETLVPSGNGDEIVDLTLQPGTDESELRFTWLSNVDEPGTVTVWETGTEPSTFDSMADALSQRSGYLTNKATVFGLEPGKTYNYKVSNGSTESETYTFSTNESVSSFSFLLAGDIQIGSGSVSNDISGWQNAMRNISGEWSDISFIVSAGDQVNTSTSEDEYDGVFSPGVLTSIPMAPSVGNHDNSANYQGHYNLPNLSEIGSTSAGGDYWYSYGKVLFMHLNSNNSDIDAHEEFMKMAIEAYKAANGGNEPEWKVVVFHHALYSSASHAKENGIRDRRADWSPVLSELDIDAALNGHDHVYTRSFMMEGTPVEGVAVGGGSTPITTGYTSVGDNIYAEYAKKKMGETVYFEASSSSGSKFYGIEEPDYPFVAFDEQKRKSSIIKIDVTSDSLTFNAYYTDTEIDSSSPFDSFVLK